jgi:ketosteroid isomerase-like protein
MYAAFSELADDGDIETYVATYWDPACEYDPVEETEIIRGSEAMVRWHQRWFEAWGALSAHVEELVELDDAIVTRIRVEGRGDASGTAVSQRFFHVIETGDGRIVRMREFVDEAEAFRAARDPGPDS